MARFEFKSKSVTTGSYDFGEDDKVQQTCNEWAAEGFIVFSVICPDPRNYNTFRLTARRDREESFTPPLFEETT